jgi:hypothetical protein
MAASVIPLELLVLLIASAWIAQGTMQASVSYQRDGMEEEEAKRLQSLFVDGSCPPMLIGMLL